MYVKICKQMLTLARAEYSLRVHNQGLKQVALKETKKPRKNKLGENL